MNKTALCPLDGRYGKRLGTLRSVMGEAAFAVSRLRSECAWFYTLSTLRLPRFKALTKTEEKLLANVCVLSEQDLEILRAIEFDGCDSLPPTQHDVKAIEYFLKFKLKKTSLANRLEWFHFALTSEDVNSAAYAMLLSDGLEKALLPALEKIQKGLIQLARKEADAVLLARTHGQAAVPTTFGREIRVFAERLSRQIKELKTKKISCKFGGAIGAYNAHYVAFPQVNWPKIAEKFVAQLNKGRRIKIFLSPISTQVDNRDSYAEVFDNIRRINIILLDFCQDIWWYISQGLVRQKTVRGEVGSSTMPQKVNPIDFENAEGNIQLANSLLELFSRKLPVSRLQRDLSDSTVLRNMSVSFGYALTAYLSVLKGLSKISFNRTLAKEELNAHPEVLAEAIQTVLRAVGYSNPYETLRDFTRGQKTTFSLLQTFIEELEIDQPTKKRLLALMPEKYIGLSAEQARGEK
ncbi:MAG: adenylosuccinate lyase [Elusimicrobiaceae bacterium]|nr:adenylosuccinate lyase [Elusimicrobiaceae bacterium]